MNVEKLYDDNYLKLQIDIAKWLVTIDIGVIALLTNAPENLGLAPYFRAFFLLLFVSILLGITTLISAAGVTYGDFQRRRGNQSHETSRWNTVCYWALLFAICFMFVPFVFIGIIVFRSG